LGYVPATPLAEGLATHLDALHDGRQVKVVA
jgi:hypothetical protein